METRFDRWITALAVRPELRTGPRRWDWILAALFALGSVAEVLLIDHRWPAARLVVALAICALLPYRRRHSVSVALLAIGLEFALTILFWIDGTASDVTLGQAFAGLMIIYALCRWPTPRNAALGMAAAMTMVFIGSFSSGDSVALNLGGLIPWGVLAAFALAMRYRARLGEVEHQGVRLSERNILARELHDSVAHHVSAIAVQAQAARFVAASNPDAVVEAIEAIEATANTAIDEMRRMVGVLRSDDDEARTVAPTSLAGLARPDGTPRVSLLGESDLSSLPSPIAAAVYRIAQEAITNATRHSDGVTFVDIELRLDPTNVRLLVINDGGPTTRNSGSGFGLVGMAERVAALDGTITTGPRPASGWSVEAVLPLGRRG